MCILHHVGAVKYAVHSCHSSKKSESLIRAIAQRLVNTLSKNRTFGYRAETEKLLKTLLGSWSELVRRAKELDSRLGEFQEGHLSQWLMAYILLMRMTLRMERDDSSDPKKIGTGPGQRLWEEKYFEVVLRIKAKKRNEETNATISVSQCQLNIFPFLIRLDN